MAGVKGKKNTPEHNLKISIAKTGKKFPYKPRPKALGRIPWNKGKPMPIGEQANNWKGGVSRAYKTGYYSMEYKAWRKAVFTRDNWTCQKCFSKEEKYVTAHHIKSFAKFPDLRFEVSNGLTLCELCHCEMDKYRARFKKK